MAEALTALDRCLELAPDFYTARSNRGVSLKSVGRVEEAIAEFRCCLEVDPQNVSVLANYGFALQESEQIDEAIEIYRRCLALSPDYIDVYINLGAVLKDDGQIEEAITCYRQCLAVDPKNAKARSNLLFCLNYDPKTDRERFFAEHCQWDDLHGLQFRTHPKGFGNEFLQEKKLRIGFVSGDFMRHPVGFLLLPIFTRLDRSGLEIYCYSSATGKDELTQRFMAAAHHWREVADLADEEFARVIEDDGIDILLDLAGHTAGNRLPVFARRPAPVQLSWLGYFATTGLKSMDYVIMDQHTVPAEMTGDFVEKVLYLPHSRFCFLPSEQTPEVAPLPALANGAITFGSFNNLTKINALVVGLWAAVLKAVPDSKLIVKWKGLESEQKRAEIVRAFAEHGVEAHRLELRGHSSHWEMLAQYGDVDIALDTYPFSGGMTSCLALWMGVPIVTLPGDRPVSRQTYAFLKNIGLNECVAADREDFVRKAVELAGNLERLVQFRATLRERMQASPVCDADGMAKNLEQLLREVWRRRCAVGGQ
jgi:predicted O-linked N-acetylglucosamine transferase (SPINDLY family)